MDPKEVSEMAICRAEDALAIARNAQETRRSQLVAGDLKIKMLEKRLAKARYDLEMYESSGNAEKMFTIREKYRGLL